eukprot:TRINITY_DN940_c1_g2_i1.p1 TRINITY_DN940_c1_g2~~TRINITY_DN940_c1_g2_i1.p1  ORF type:complete len:629 (+),score=72.09 TRINITY_DN940_c1_g2_i1:74-1888(+)
MSSPIHRDGVIHFEDDADLSQTIQLRVDKASAMRVNGWLDSQKRISWSTFFWTTWVIGSLIWTVDRLLWNCWPRNGFGDGFGGDFSPMKTPLTSTTIYNFLIRTTGRLTTSTLCGLLVTSFKEIFSYLQRQQDRRKLRFINFHGWEEANYKAHILLGKLLGVWTVIHVLAIFLPIVLSGWTHVTYKSGPLTLPLSETKTCPDFDYDLQIVCLSTDDIIRFVVTLVTFIILFPLSQSSMVSRSNYNLSRLLHFLGSLWYCVDITRKKTHPHTWFLNIPLIIFWAIDRAYGWWKTMDVTVTIRRLDADYFLLEFQDVPRLASTETIAPTISISLKDFNKVDCSHRLTLVSQCCVKNRRSYSEKGHKFGVSLSEPLLESDVGGNPLSRSPSKIQRKNSILQCVVDEENQKWHPANPFTLVRVSRTGEDGDIKQCSFLNKKSATAALAKGAATKKVTASVPVCSAYHQLLFVENMPPVILIASGSGAGMLLDFVYYLVKTQTALLNTVKIFYTSRSLALFQFVTDLLCEESIHNLEISSALTAPGFEYSPSHPTRDMQIGRMNVSDMIRNADPSTRVFFCGTGSLQKELTSLCSKHSLNLCHSHSFDA